jgi:uncharacterized protein (DUF3820 family)
MAIDKAEGSSLRPPGENHGERASPENVGVGAEALTTKPRKTQMNDSSVKHRAEARERARATARLAVEEAGRIESDSQGSFWDELRKMLPLAATTAIASLPTAMTDRQARAFGQSRMPFGEFQGARIDDVPLDRLQWYADLSPFQQQLRRYLASGRIRSEEEDDGG